MSEFAVAGATAPQPAASPASAGNEILAGDTEMPLVAVDPGQARPEGACPPLRGGVHAP